MAKGFVTTKMSKKWSSETYLINPKVGWGAGRKEHRISGINLEKNSKMVNLNPSVSVIIFVQI